MEKNFTYTLNKNWYMIDGNNCPDESFYGTGIPRENAHSITLPHFTHMSVEDHVGISWYECIFTLPELPENRQIALLCFEQAVFRAVVSVNGQIIGEHVGVEDPFSFNVTNILRAGENRITVRISKPHDIHVDGYDLNEIPHRNQTPHGLRPGWCYNESGISGEVFLRVLPEVFLEDLYLYADPETGNIRVKWTVFHSGNADSDAVLELEARRFPEGDAETGILLPVQLHPGENTGETVLHLENPRLWNLEEPNLYTVRGEITTSAGTHSMERRTGFRTFLVGEDGYFYLNGKRIYLKCSHTGNCMPESGHHFARDAALLRRDFLMAKSVGFNMIRFISGCALPLQMDLCDEIGLMIYEEPVASWRSQKGPHMEQLYREDLLTMIRRDRSHPSVTVWGLINEMKPESPDGEVNEVARAILPELRRWDDTRLVLYGSGRWDKNPQVGSLANPFSNEWQNLWGWDGDGLSPDGDLGDIHFYPAVPLRPENIQRILNFGNGTPRPVFVSETGAGSALDTISLTKHFEHTNAVPFAPDVKMIRIMNELLHRDIEKFGFADCIPFPSELMRSSMKNHVYYRTQMYDLLRSNPNLCGISLTGLLDHSICGEGLWTLFREFKPGMADVLQDGFSSLRWNVILSAPSLRRGDSLTVQASIASEDILPVGSSYHVRAAILGQNGEFFDARDYSFTVTEESARRMVIPVFTDSWDTSSLDAGEYEIKVEVMAGADVSGGIRTFHVCPAVKTRTERTVYITGLSEQDAARVESFGFHTEPLENYRDGGAVLAGFVEESNRDVLAALLANEAHILAVRSAQDQSVLLLPENRRPVLGTEWDWLYHREFFLRPGDPYFTGMRTGLADARLFTGILTPNDFRAEGEQVPDYTHAFAFLTGYHKDPGFFGGFKLGSYKVGEGLLTMNTFQLLEIADRVPYAAQMLHFNMQQPCFFRQISHSLFCFRKNGITAAISAVFFPHGIAKLYRKETNRTHPHKAGITLRRKTRGKKQCAAACLAPNFLNLRGDIASAIREKDAQIGLSTLQKRYRLPLRSRQTTDSLRHGRGCFFCLRISEPVFAANEGNGAVLLHGFYPIRAIGTDMLRSTSVGGRILLIQITIHQPGLGHVRTELLQRQFRFGDIEQRKIVLLHESHLRIIQFRPLLTARTEEHLRKGILIIQHPKKRQHILRKSVHFFRIVFCDGNISRRICLPFQRSVQ